MTTETTATPAIHPFEKAGLGKAPFRCIGHHVSKYQACPGAPVQPGSSCDYCGQGIMDVFTIKGADGKTFKVGCDCVYKVNKTAATTIEQRAARALKDQVNKFKTAKANERKDEKIEEARATLETFRAQLMLVWFTPPPAKWAKSVAEQVDWLLANGGRANKLRGVKLLNDTVRAQGWM